MATTNVAVDVLLQGAVSFRELNIHSDRRVAILALTSLTARSMLVKGSLLEIASSSFIIRFFWCLVIV